MPRDLTGLFARELTAHYHVIAAQLLRINANVPSHGNVALAGGYLRDVYFNLKTPKDMDFAFTHMDTNEFGEALSRYLRRLSCDVTVADKTSSTDYAGECAANRIIKVYGVTEHHADGPIEMDWILYNEDSTAGVMAKLDYTVNKFTAEYTEDFRLQIQWHGDAWGTCTRNPKAAVPPERVERFKEIARVIDWEYVDVAAQ